MEGPESHAEDHAPANRVRSPQFSGETLGAHELGLEGEIHARELATETILARVPDDDAFPLRPPSLGRESACIGSDKALGRGMNDMTADGMALFRQFADG